MQEPSSPPPAGSPSPFQPPVAVNELVTSSVLEANNLALMTSVQTMLNTAMAAMTATFKEASISSSVPAAAAALPTEESALPLEGKHNDEDSTLVPRPVPTNGGDVRVRGGEARVLPRATHMRRALAPDMSEEEMDKAEDFLALAAKVGSRPHSSAHAHDRKRNGKQPSRVTRMLTGGGVLPYESESEQALAGIMSAFKAKGKAEKGKVKEYKTFGEWFEHFSSLGMFSQGLLFEDPETYWEFQWHKNCVLYVLGEYDWSSASTYDTEVLTRWDRLDIAGLTASMANEESDWAEACYQPALIRATFVQRKAGRSQAGTGAGAGRNSSAGSTTKVNSDDTYCSNPKCKKWYPKKTNHYLTVCRQPGGGAYVKP